MAVENNKTKVQKNNNLYNITQESTNRGTEKKYTPIYMRMDENMPNFV